MLSRRHIRVKVMQALYSYYAGDQHPQPCILEKNMQRSLTQLYDLYLYLMVFLQELGHFCKIYDEEVRARHLASPDVAHHLRFYNNPLLQRIVHSDQLDTEASRNNAEFQGDVDMLRRLFLNLKNSEEYRDYIASAQPNKFENEGILTYILKHYPLENNILSHHLEEQFINWYDDRKIAVNMAVKTVKQMNSQEPPEQQYDEEGEPVENKPQQGDILMPLADDPEEHFTFAAELLHKTIEDKEELEGLIKSKITKWEPNQVARIDIILLSMALCEFLHFPSIPTKVTINEYIELAKNYSTPKSKKFINGVLDNLLAQLQQEGRIRKSGRGLIA